MTAVAVRNLDHLVVRGKRATGDLADRITGAHISLSAPLQGGAFSVSVLTLNVDDPDLTVWNTHLFDRGATVDIGTFYGRVTDSITRESGSGTEIAVTVMSEGASILLDERGAQNWQNISPSQLAVQLGESAHLQVVAEPSHPVDLLFRTEPDVTVPGDRGESSWDMLARYAKALGFVLFEAYGVLYYGRPSWLIHKLQTLRVTWDPRRPPDDLLQMPTCHRTQDGFGRDVRDVTMRVTAQAAARTTPGMALELRGIERFSTTYMISSVDFDVDDAGEGSIVATLPTDPIITPGDAASVAGSGAADGGGTEFGKFVNAISDQETGGVYGSVNDRTGALGRYQVLPSNVGPWSKKVLGRTVTTSEFLNNPDLQDAIALGVLWSYYSAHGARGAAAIWYSGDPLRQNDYKRSKSHPNEPSVGEYCDEVLDKMKTASGALPSSYNGPGSGTPSVVSAKKSATQFIYYAQSQVDDHTPYVYGAKAADSVLDPQALDCSGLTAWAAGRCGVDLPDGARNQQQFCAVKQTAIGVTKGLVTPGALLFRIGVGTEDHVAISLGDNRRTIEAMGRKYGVIDGSSVDRGWTSAALVPGMAYS